MPMAQFLVSPRYQDANLNTQGMLQELKSHIGLWENQSHSYQELKLSLATAEPFLHSPTGLPLYFPSHPILFTAFQ